MERRSEESCRYLTLLTQPGGLHWDLRQRGFSWKFLLNSVVRDHVSCKGSCHLLGLLQEWIYHEHMNSKAVVETLKINTIKYVSTEGGVCTEIFKQKFQDRRKSYISQQSWYVQTKFSGKKQDSLKKKNPAFIFLFLDPEFDSKCRNWSNTLWYFLRNLSRLLTFSNNLWIGDG